ncbi:MAG: autoinducer binding domain-containing protein [Hyphomicrobiales bacterium]
MTASAAMIPRFDMFNEAAQPFASIDESSDYLRQSRDRFSVLNLSYWFLGTSPKLPDRLTWLSTYDQEYMRIYMREYSPLKDPAFDVCFRRLLPLDWGEMRETDEQAQVIHQVAEQFGIGRHGISFPIRDPGFGDAMFSVNFECDDRQWQSLRNDLVNGFHLFAHFYHLRMKDLISHRPVSAEFDLSPREREVLAWAADGKTAWETAQLLGVSERAIRLYTENAMNKLRAKTKTQAVAIAVKNEIIH